MKPSEQCKQAGLKSLAELSKLTDEKTRTLINWHTRYPKRFAIMLDWAVLEKEWLAHKDKVWSDHFIK